MNKVLLLFSKGHKSAKYRLCHHVAPIYNWCGPSQLSAPLSELSNAQPPRPSAWHGASWELVWREEAFGFHLFCTSPGPIFLPLLSPSPLHGLHPLLPPSWLLDSALWPQKLILSLHLPTERDSREHEEPTTSEMAEETYSPKVFRPKHTRISELKAEAVKKDRRKKLTQSKFVGGAENTAHSRVVPAPEMRQESEQVSLRDSPLPTLATTTSWSRLHLT